MLLLHFGFWMIDLLPESPSSKEELSTVTVASPDVTNATKVEILDLPLALWSESQNKRKGMSLDSLEIPALEVGSVAQIEAFQQQSSRFVSCICSFIARCGW